MVDSLAIFAIFIFPVAALFGAPIILAILKTRNDRLMKELEIRELEAKARLMEAEATAAIPSFVDARDPEALAAYAAARKEVSGRERGL